MLLNVDARACGLFLWMGCVVGSVHAAPLFEERPFPDAVQKAFVKAGIDPASVAAYAQPLAPVVSRRPVVYSMGGQLLSNPASVTKVFTAGLALDKLGPAYRFKTDFQVQDKPVDGVLSGALYIRGTGNPAFQTSDLWAALRRLRADGLKTIRGDVVLDRTAFRPVREDEAVSEEGFEDDAPYRAYHAQPDALLLNYGSMMLQIKPSGDFVQVFGQEAPSNWAFVSGLKGVKGACGTWKNSLSLDVRKVGDGVKVTLSGNYPTSCGENNLPVRIAQQDWLWESWFRELWAQLGGEFRGKVVNGVTPAGATVLHSVASDPLPDLIRLMNKHSSNVIARHLELAVAGPAGDFNQLMKGWLATLGIRAADWTLENGSGLTRNNRLDAKGLTDFLSYMATRADFPDFLASLPRAGTDGTLSRQLKNIEAYGYLKTGSLNGVRTLGGYVRDTSGQWWALGVIVQSPKAWAAWPPLETLVEAVYQQGKSH